MRAQTHINIGADDLPNLGERINGINRKDWHKANKARITNNYTSLKVYVVFAFTVKNFYNAKRKNSVLLGQKNSQYLFCSFGRSLSKN